MSTQSGNGHSAQHSVYGNGGSVPRANDRDMDGYGSGDDGQEHGVSIYGLESATPTTVEVQVPREGLHAGTSYEAILPAVR